MTNASAADNLAKQLYQLAARASRYCERYPEFDMEWATVTAELARVHNLVKKMSASQVRRPYRRRTEVVSQISTSRAV
jgi:hypothetical protein